MFDQAMARIAGRFRRVEPRATARAYLLGLLSGVERKNCWTLAEQTGHARPGPMQRLLRSARWDADAVRDKVRAYAVEHLGTDGGVLIVDETGFVKKGRSSAGVQRQYTGTAGRIENSRVGVFLAYATSRGRALIDRWLYLPEHSWCCDAERRDAAGVPGDVQFATKPRLAWEMIAAALDAGVEAPWVTGDEAYGQDPQFRAALEARGTGYVLAVDCSVRVRTNSGRTPVRADTVAGRLPEAAWHRQSAGAGAKGPRYYDWAWIGIGNSHRHLLIRRNPTTRELAFYLCWSPTAVPLAEIVREAGTRWSVEECFQARKGPSRPGSLPGEALERLASTRHTRDARAGLPHCRHRRHSSQPTARTASLHPRQQPDRPDRPGNPPPVRRSPQPSSCVPGQTAALVKWRRRHQATALRSHYRRRSADETGGSITKSHWSTKAGRQYCSVTPVSLTALGSSTPSLHEDHRSPAEQRQATSRG